jgi:hypothetical protein
MNPAYFEHTSRLPLPTLSFKKFIPTCQRTTDPYGLGVAYVALLQTGCNPFFEKNHGDSGPMGLGLPEPAPGADFKSSRPSQRAAPVA